MTEITTKKTYKSPLAELISASVSASGQQGVAQLWERVTDEGCVSISTSDAENRPKFVTLQARIEFVVAQSLPSYSAVGVIHTKLPPTPLRTEGTLTEGLVAPEIMSDQARASTVLVRADILREYLHANGTLIALYSKDHVDANTPGIQIYHKLLAVHPNLIDQPVEGFDEQNSGATYLIREKGGDDSATSVFMIAAPQANNPKDGTMSMCFGALTAPAVSDKFGNLLNFLDGHGVDLHGKLAASNQEVALKE